jgi:6-phosphogluconolactonase
MRTLSLPNANVLVLPDANTLSRGAADEFARAARSAIDSHGRFTVALSGGSTPKAMFSLLAADHRSGMRPLPWERIHVFFGDERHVPPDHPESNFRMASESLLTHVPIPQSNIHRVLGELEAPVAATRYEAELRSVFETSPGKIPRFDLILLGMGPDGHTASLFPGSAALDETTALVTANWVEKFKSHRITFTFTLLNAASEVIFLAAGGDKTEMLRNILRGDPSGQTYPAQDVRPSDGQLTWMVDEAASRTL